MALEPDALFLYLDQQVADEGNTEERIGGMRVKVEYTAVPPEAAQQKRSHIVKSIIDSIRNKPGWE